MVDSISALVDYWNRLEKTYGADRITSKPAVSLKDNELKGLDKVASFEELVGKVNQAIVAGC